MARLLSRTLLLRHTTTTTKPPQSITSLLHRRHRSTQSGGKAQLIEIDFDSSDGDVEVLGGTIRKLDDLIHGIIVQRSAPAWLPFIPGSSYWVPPKRKPHNIGELIGKLTNSLTEEEELSLTTVRGWPCSSCLVEGDASEHLVEEKVEHTSIDDVEVEVEVEIKVQTNTGNASRSEDEEG